MRTTRRARREARQLFRFCVVNGLLDARRAVAVAKRVAETRRRGSLAVLSYFERLVKLDRARHRAVVESAAPLPPEISARVETDVLRLYGPGIDVSFVENDGLIGGMRVRVASDVYDGTVRRALTALGERF